MLFKIIKLYILVFSFGLYGDSLKYNSLNSHGIVGLVNTPNARILENNTLALSIHKQDNVKNLSVSYTAFNFLELSISSIETNNKNISKNLGEEHTSTSVKIRVKEEGMLPALAIGLNNFDGPATNSSEYIVANYGLSNFDFSLGIGWGALNANDDYSNKLSNIDDNLLTRPGNLSPYSETQVDDFFSGENVSVFGGINYALDSNFLVKFEYDTYKKPFSIKEGNKSNINLGIEYIGIENLNFSIYSNEEKDIFFKLSYLL